MSDRAKHAAAEARRTGADFTPPDLEKTIKRRRRARIAAVATSSALAIVVLIGVGALFIRTESDSLPMGTTSTTALPDESITTTRTPTTEPTVTTEAALPTEPIYGGVVTVGSGTSMMFGMEMVDGTIRPATINPLLDQWNASDVARLTVPGAYRMDPGTGEPKPWVVTEIPRLDNGGVVIAEDGVTVTYHIKPQAVWADGTPISALDFAFTHELIMREDLYIDGNLREIHSLIDFDTLVAIGDMVTFDLTRSDPRYERLFPWLVPAHAVDPETFAEDWNDKLWLSGGPFVFESFTPAPSFETEPGIFQLSRNDNYWEFDDAGNQLPYLDGIEVQVFEPGAVMPVTIASWFTTASVDAMLGGTVDRYLVSSLGDPDEENFVLAQSWDSLYEILGFQLGDRRFERNPGSLNEHLLYRQAVLTAIDRIAIGEAERSPVTSIAGAASPGLDTRVWDQYDDPGRTADLLAELGTQLGRDFTAEPPAASLVSSTGDTTIRIGELIVQQLEAAGWEATGEFNWDFFNIWLPEGQTDIHTIRLFAGDGLADLVHLMSYFDPMLPEDELLYDWASIGEPAQRFSDVMAEARATLDPDRMAELLLEAETILADNAIVYPLVRRQVFYTPYWPDRIQGIIPLQGWETQTAAWWWSPTAG